ncbi:MAG: hypothetical protein RQ875_14735 [Vicingaceae bacterium]|nr:hypothetical protein [Vicingaceae bacterium]
MIKENKVSKYLLYAIGEIVLVVIGILIALQINTNSENQKKLEFEITILKNIKEDILSDKVDCELNLDYIKIELTNEQRLLDFLFDENAQPKDSISFNDALGIDLITVFHNASFNNLQNNDIGLISNNKLYKEITRFYDFYVSALKELENTHDYGNTYDDKFIYFKKHFTVINKKTKRDFGSENDAWNQEFERYNFAIKNVDVLKKDEEFKILLAESILINSLKVSFYQQLFEKTENLIKSIDSELETLKK